ncbi:MAG: Uma2 family endonuclease [Saprospiraceae bacterium]|nr:Uma2 family endonuclease [Saprospiraceae bacterium]
MTATAAQQLPSPLRKAAKNPKKISWERFAAKYLTREDEWKYEWVDGIVEKTKRDMYERQFNILANLRTFFISLLTSGKASGYLEPEIDILFLPTVHRRPDLVYFTEEQRINMAHGEEQIPNFVIEIISSSDQMTLVHQKMRNYREANVQVIWHIFPELEEVHVYQGNEMTIYTGEMICSASSVVPGFELPVQAVFQIPAKSSYGSEP